MNVMQHLQPSTLDLKNVINDYYNDFKINDKVESISTDSTNNIEEQNENNAPKKDPALLQIIERFDGEIIT